MAEQTQIVAVEPIPLGDGVLWFQSPFVVPFYLLKAKRLRDAAEPRRVRALERPIQERDGTFSPRRPDRVFDALEDLALSVFLSLAAIERHTGTRR